MKQLKTGLTETLQHQLKAAERQNGQGGPRVKGWCDLTATKSVKELPQGLQSSLAMDLKDATM